MYEEVLEANGIMDMAIFTELEDICCIYGALVTEAIHEKNTYKHYIGVDACASNLMSCHVRCVPSSTVLARENEEASEVYDVVGSLCENNTSLQ